MRPEKKAIVEEIRGRLEQAGCVFVVDFSGMKVEQMSEFRGLAGKSNMRVLVVPNALFKRAAGELGLGGVEGFLAGPTAILTGTGEVTEVAKAVHGFVKKNNVPVVKGGFLGKLPLSAGDVDAMAKMPPRLVLLGQVVGTIAAPMTRLVGVMSQKLMSLLYVLKAVEERKSAGQKAA